MPQCAQDVRDDWLTEKTSKLNAIVKRNAFQSQETLLLTVLAEFDQIAAFMFLFWLT